MLKIRLFTGVILFVFSTAAFAQVTSNQKAPDFALTDTNGQLGHLYDAQTTPHIFIINPQGILIYQGAIDDAPSTDIEDVKTAKNYLSAALDAAMNGKPVAVSTTKSYGCSVKY